MIEPSRDGKNGAGSGGTFFDDNGATLGRTPYIAEKRVKIPVNKSGAEILAPTALATHEKSPRPYRRRGPILTGVTPGLRQNASSGRDFDDTA